MIFSAIGISNASIGMGFNVLTDRSQGGSSINNGWVELMVHRRCLNDDDAGVAEPLNEKAYGEGLVARGQGVLTHFVQNESLLILNVLAGKHYPIIGTEQELNRATRVKMNSKYLSPTILMIPANNLSLQQWLTDTPLKTKRGLERSLRENVNVMTLESAGVNQVSLKFTHSKEDHSKGYDLFTGPAKA